MKNKSHKNMLNKRGPKIDPCGTPNKTSSHEQNSEFIFIFSISCLINNFASALKLVNWNHKHLI